VSRPKLTLDGPLAASSASQHVFLDRLTRSDRGSRVVRTFANEYSVLRRAARALDAALSDSHDAYRTFMQGLGLIGQCWVDQALPATRTATEQLQALIRNPDTRDGAIWAMERVGTRWARICAPTSWGTCFWSARSETEALVPDPQAAASRETDWTNGRDAALQVLATWLDALESSVTDERVA
jgi:hypothetical protein